MSARRRSRRRRVFTLGERFRRMLHGIVIMALGISLIAATAAFASGAASYMNVNLTIAGNNVNLPLGTITTVILGFMSLFTLFYAIRYTIGIRL